MKSDWLIISDYSNCVSFCQTCCISNKICFECKAFGHVSIYPALRACQNCINEKQRCIKSATFIITTDCKEGNKKMFISLEKKLKKKILIRIFRCTTSRQKLKSVWYLTLFDEPGCLSFLYTLRNKADTEETKIMKNLVRKNNFIRNKDRQDPNAL